MKKRVIISTIIILFLGMFFLHCSKTPEDVLTKKFKALSQETNQKLKTIRTRKQYNNLLKEREKKLNSLIKEFENKKLSGEDKLTLGYMFIETKKFDKAEKNFKPLLQNSKFKKKAIIGMIEIYLNKRDLININKYLDMAKKDYGENLQEFAPYFLIGGLNQRSKDKSAKYLEIALKYRLKPPFTRYVGYGIENYLKAKNLNKEQKLKLITRIKTLYAGEQALIKQLNKIETVLKMIGSSAFEITTDADWINSKKPLSLAQFKGKFVVLEFFAPWCSHCRGSLPHMVELYNKLRNKGFIVIGITSYYGSYADGEKKVEKVSKEEELKLITEFLEKNNVNFPIMVTKGRDLGDKYGVSGIPCFILISREGKILKRYEGAIPTLYGEIEQFVNKN